MHPKWCPFTSFTPSSRQVIPELRCGEVNGGFYMLHCNARTRHTKSNFWDLFVRCMVDKRSPPLLQSNFWVPSWGNYKAGDRWESRLRVVSSKLAEGSIPLRCFWQQVLREEQANVFLACSLWGKFDRLDGSVQGPFLLAELLAKQTYFAFLSSSERFLKLRLLSLNFYCWRGWRVLAGLPKDGWLSSIHRQQLSFDTNRQRAIKKAPNGIKLADVRSSANFNTILSNSFPLGLIFLALRGPIPLEPRTATSSWCIPPGAIQCSTAGICG